MTFDEYQKLAARTVPVPGRTGEQFLAIFALGLCGEAGEAADLIKKHLGHGHDLDLVKLTKELGDVLWYLAGLSTVLGIDLNRVAHANIEKLRARYPDGFDVERSKTRAEGDT